MHSSRRTFVTLLGGQAASLLLPGCASQEACPPAVAPEPETRSPPNPAPVERATVVSHAAEPPQGPAPAKGDTKVLLFDAFPIFDPRPVFQLGEELFPGRGAELGEQWRRRQFEYTWLRTASHRYKDFWHVTDDALHFACSTLKLDLTEEKRSRLMNAYLELKSWPDARPTLDKVRAAGIKMAFLSNMTEKMLASCIAASNLDGYFDRILSTDQQQTYKPDPRAYQIGLDSFGVTREEAVFVAFAGWDASGAKWFGYPTYWTNRLRLEQEKLDVQPDAQGPDLNNLPSYLGI